MGERIELEGHQSSHSMKKKTDYSITSSENYFDFLSEPPTLLNIASVSIAIKLWTDAGMNKFMVNQRQNYTTDVYFGLEYCRLEERALKKVSELILPKSLKLNITHCMMPIGLQLQLSFKQNGKEYCRFYDLHKKGGLLYWTMEGVIDQVKSLKELISNDVRGKTLDQYQLACKYCLEENIFNLWKKVPPTKIMLVDAMCKNYNNHILAYWTAVQKNELSDLLTKFLPNDDQLIYNSDLGINENMILLSIFVGNPFAFKYFWHKLSHHEKNVNIENWVIKLTDKIKRYKYINYQTYNVYTVMLWFLLTQINDPEKQKQIFHVHSKILLRSLLYYWPFQRFFLPAMIKLMNYIHIDIYASIMKDLVSQIKDRRLTGEQFRTIWHHSPLKFQDHFLSVLNNKFNAKLVIISTLLLAGDILTICILLKNDSAVERKMFVTNLIQYDLKRLIQENKLMFADALLSKLLSEGDINAFKQHIMVTYANDLCCDCIRKLNYNAAEQFLNWGFQSPSEIQDFKRNKLNLNEIFISLIHLGDFDYANRFLSWCFDSENEVSQFKKCFISEDNIFYCEKLLFRLSSLGDNGWIIFGEFLNYSSCSFATLATLKKLLLKEVGHIVEGHNLMFASLLLNWCLPSMVEVNQYKNKLLLSRRGINTILESLQLIPNWGKTKRVLTWFSPLSREVVAKLKYTLITNKFRSNRRIHSPRNQKKALFYLLDFFVDNQNKHDFKHIIEFDWDVNGILNGEA